MKRALLVALALAFPSSAQANRCDVDRAVDGPLRCSHMFIAAAHPQVFRAETPAGMIATRWATKDAEFLTGADPDSCVDFGRIRAVRVRENYCADPDAIVVTVRSTGAREAVEFQWERVRR